MPFCVGASVGSNVPSDPVNVTIVPFCTAVPADSVTVAITWIVPFTGTVVELTVIAMVELVGATSGILSHAATRTSAQTKKRRAKVRGTGAFKGALAKGATVRLILQGRGIACDEPDNFKHFTLEVAGAKGTHTFYGALAQPSP